jgi:6-phosphogluconate dehydrogenase (decarboxylating)
VSAYVVAEGLGIWSEDEDMGQVNWLVDDVLQMEVAAPVIAAAAMRLIASRDEASAGRERSP